METGATGVPAERGRLDLTFLGSGNAFAFEGRAFSSFLLNERYLFDCGPTLLQQMRKARLRTEDIDVVVISHFHGDHFLGLPFLVLDSWFNKRRSDLTIVGPPGVEARTESLLQIAYARVAREAGFERRYVEVTDGATVDLGDLQLEASQVVHSSELECFAFRATHAGRSLMYSGDTTLCEGLLRLVPGSEAVVVECSAAGVPVHLSLAGVREVQRNLSPGAKLIVTHLDGLEPESGLDGLIVASDLARYSF